MINGNDGGLNISYDNGAHWIKCNTPAVGQFYAVAVDHLAPYNVYGGLQDNGVWKGSSKTVESVRWHQSGQYPYTMIMGGDGMQVAVDNRDHNTVYTGYQFGNYYRLDLAADKQTYIQPKHSLGERPYRFNWQTPILLSAHNQDILYRSFFHTILLYQLQFHLHNNILQVHSIYFSKMFYKDHNRMLVLFYPSLKWF